MGTTKQVPLCPNGRLSCVFFIFSLVTVLLEIALSFYFVFFMTQPIPYILGLLPLIWMLSGVVGAVLWLPFIQAISSEETQQQVQRMQPFSDPGGWHQQFAPSVVGIGTKNVASSPSGTRSRISERPLGNTMDSFTSGGDPDQTMELPREHINPSLSETFPDDVQQVPTEIEGPWVFTPPYDGCKGVIKVGHYCFIVPKEGRDPKRCADKFAVNGTESQYRYAIADGVSTSFIPGKWAELLSQRFVERQTDFQSKEDFALWLRSCEQEWLGWVKETWIPETERRRGRQGDWSRDIDNGAQTTFVGCSFSPQELVDNGHTTVRVFAIGDSNFFLVRPPGASGDRWKYVSYPMKNFEDFGPVPAILTTVTTDRQIGKAWRKAQENTGSPPERDNPYKEYDIKLGDYMILTTDALAEWILQQHVNQISPWNSLIYHLPHYDAFRAFVQEQRQKGMERDDTTMLIVHLKPVK
jgi:hypothetical protein